jgi:cold shock CspA family protein
VLSADEVPGDIFAHFSVIEMDGYKSLRPGALVEATVEGPVVRVEGCQYAASVVRPIH